MHQKLNVGVPGYDNILWLYNRLDLGALYPSVLGPDNVKRITSLDELQADRVEVHKARLLLCLITLIPLWHARTGSSKQHRIVRL